MKPIARSILFLLLTLTSHINSSDTDRKPPIPFIDVGACPFECCTYRQWTVVKRVAVFDRPKGEKLVETLYNGDIVRGLTGEVISVPVSMKADRDVPDTPIKKGDTFYVLHYDGEGYWKVWLDGKITFVHESVMDFPKPKAEWWVKIKDSHGTVGWALSKSNFAHQDVCE